MKCPKCGNLCPYDAKFCGLCGTFLETQYPTHLNQVYPKVKGDRGFVQKKPIWLLWTSFIFILIFTFTMFFLNSGNAKDVGLNKISQEDPLLVAAKNVLREYITIPYQNDKYQILSNDGAFGTVRVSLEVRQSVDKQWTDYICEISCKKVGDVWSCNKTINLKLSPALVQKTSDAILKATESSAFEKKSISVSFKNISFNGTEIIVTYNVTNSGKLPHRIAVEYAFNTVCLDNNGSIIYDDSFSFIRRTGVGHSVYLTSGGVDRSKEISLLPGETKTKVDSINDYGGYSIDRYTNGCKEFKVSNPRLDLSCMGCKDFIWLD